MYDTNLAPVVGAEAAGRFWVAVRDRWAGARWRVDHAIVEGDHAACEWTMTGRAPLDGRPFAFRGSDHYRFDGDLIAEVRQYWTFDPRRLDTKLVGYPYPAEAEAEAEAEASGAEASGAVPPTPSREG